MGPLRRACPALLSLALAGCGGGDVRDPPGPAPGPSPVVDPAARARRELLTLRELIEADPAVAAALALTTRTPEAEARAVWKAGRTALRHLAARHELPRLVAEVQGSDPTPEGFADLCRLALVERLLAVSHPPEPEPLFPAGQEPGLPRALARGVAVRTEPSIDGTSPAALPEGRDRYRQAISAGGRSWRALRALEATRIDAGPGLGFNSRIWRQNPAGERFRDPTDGIPAVLLGSTYPERDQVRLELAPEHLEAAVTPPEGDLVLLLVAWNLHGSTHPVLELVGRDLTVPIPIEAPEGSEAMLGLPEHVAAGLDIRVRRGVLPPGLRKLTLRMVALQPIGRPEATCNATELLEQVAGPLPAVFEGHGWASPPPGPAAR